LSGQDSASLPWWLDRTVAVLPIHFHIDPFADVSLLQIIRDTLWAIKPALDDFNIRTCNGYHSVGRYLATSEAENPDITAYVIRQAGLTGHSGICFAPTFNDFSDTQQRQSLSRANILFREHVRFLGGQYKDFALEYPAPNGQRGKDGLSDYANLPKEQAVFNPSSYAAFAQQMWTLSDSRFGEGKNG
jgi:hypothetical protein